MNYESDLDFVCDLFKKCHLRTRLISPSDPSAIILDTYPGSIVGFERDLTVGQMLGVIERNTKYLLTDELNLKYIFVLLPLCSEKNILAVGPYLSSAPTAEDILEIAEQAGIALGAQRALGEYYSSVPVLTEGDKAFVALDTLCERAWQTPSFAIVELNKNRASSVVDIARVSLGESFDEIETNIKMMEMRYSFENELIRAVSLGQQHKENLLVSKLSENMFERRNADPLRNAKNYCIIMNTLLRKAAENGGVHPVHLDSTSSDFAKKIELSSEVRSCRYRPSRSIAELWMCSISPKSSKGKPARTPRNTATPLADNAFLFLKRSTDAHRQSNIFRRKTKGVRTKERTPFLPCIARA